MKAFETIVRRREPLPPSTPTWVQQTAQPVHPNPLANRILCARGLDSHEQLEFSLQHLPSPSLLLDIDMATARIVTAIESGQRILVVGDYDCDGATSTTLAVLVLKAMGAEHVDYMLPNRFIHGYGLSPAIVDLTNDFTPHLILTVDNGISSVEGVEAAREQGIDVVVTDHHLPPTTLPKAHALINPNMPGSTFPSPNIAGVGVVFFVLAAVRAELSKRDWFETQSLLTPKLADFLDLVAVGTVADVVPLDEVNRALVMQGIRRIRAGHCRPGISALLQTAGINQSQLITEGIGFGIGPRLNAAGRLDDMRLGVQCLLTDNPAEAAELARELEQKNNERKRITAEMRSDAAEILATLVPPDETPGELMSICLYESEWHEGITGLLAGRLKESYGTPAVIFARAQNQDGDEVMLKGSARSIDGYHILDAIKRVRVKHPSILEKFGGHAKAAGLSLREADFATFSAALDQDMRDFFANRKPPTELWTDGELDAQEFTLENAALLQDMAPWGQDFPAPSFDNRFLVESVRVLKERHIKYRLSPLPVFAEGADVADSLSSAADSVDAIHFNVLEPGDEPEAHPGDTVHAVYELKTNEFRGNTTLQLLLQMLQVVVSHQVTADSAIALH